MLFGGFLLASVLAIEGATALFRLRSGWHGTALFPHLGQFPPVCRGWCGGHTVSFFDMMTVWVNINTGRYGWGVNRAFKRTHVHLWAMSGSHFMGL